MTTTDDRMFTETHLAAWVAMISRGECDNDIPLELLDRIRNNLIDHGATAPKVKLALRKLNAMKYCDYVTRIVDLLNQ